LVVEAFHFFPFQGEKGRVVEREKKKACKIVIEIIKGYLII